METLLSGDQALWWDAPLKLKALQYRGLKVVHEIHSVDQFSRSVVPVTSPGVVREYALPHNQRSFWSSSMKTSLFLGRVLVSQEEVEPYVCLKGLTRGLGTSAEKVSEEFFSTDTFGVVVPDGERIIQGVGFDELHGRFKHLRGLIHRNLKETLVDSNINLDVWNNLFGITRYIPPGAGLDISVGRLWESALKNFVGAGEDSGIEITTSFDNFPRFINIATGLFAIFRKDYGRLAELYNRAAATTGMTTLDVDKQELPYFFVGRNKWGHQEWVRQTVFLSELTKLSGDAVIIPKAIPILIEILMRGPTVMPEHGSVYSSASAQFLEDLGGIGHNFVCHRVWRVRFSALDRLAGTNIKFRLPEYLREYFGTEIISGPEFAREWRSVADHSKETLEGLKAARGNFLYDLLVKDGCLNEETVGRLLFLKGKLVSDSADRVSDMDIINAEVKCLETRILARKLRKVIELIQVAKGLEYWNSRPYYWWVALMDPSVAWERSIIEKAVIYHEELQ
ncbi:MAG: hypothetical protein AAB911_02390 [Patescibacteria group bacterium]